MGRDSMPLLFPEPTHTRVPAHPRPDVFATSPENSYLPIRETAVPTKPGLDEPEWFFVAAHGGAGATLLTELSQAGAESSVSYGLNAGRAWPEPWLEPTSNVVIVCRTTMRGLHCAQVAAAQYLAGEASEDATLIGVLTVADAPGRLPRPLAAAKGLLAGVYARTWHVPFIPEYRLAARTPGEPPPPLHPVVDDVLTDIRATVATLKEGRHAHHT